MESAKSKIKEKLRRIIFDSDTPAGKIFDILLIVAIIVNSVLIIVESIQGVNRAYGQYIAAIGWTIIGLFTIEYLLRIYVSKRKSKYIFSFFGLVDLMAIVPSIAGFFLPHIKFLAIVRVFRLLRLFSIFKMGRYIEESGHLLKALKASKAKIIVFLSVILFIVVIVGALMYIIEGPENGYDNIPVSMYWAIVTLSTVGYGDISPQTPVGKMLSSLLMIVAYGIIAVPTGIITYEIANVAKVTDSKKSCKVCNTDGYKHDDKYCSKCGNLL